MLLNSKKGVFITFEGGEGAGKTTLINALSHELASQGHQVVKTREPGGTPFGEKIRAWLLDPQVSTPMTPKTELLMFLAARAQHLEEIIAPALSQGKVVLCDRFNDSTIAYQGGGRQLGIPYVSNLCKEVCGKILPDVTFFLDIEIHEGLTRTKQAEKEWKEDRMETQEHLFHQRVLDTFRLLAKQEPQRIFLLNAQKSKEQVFKEALIFLQKI